MTNVRKFIFLFILGSFVMTPLALQAQTSPHLLGRILLQVDQSGEAWYVDPLSEERTYLADGDAALSLLRDVGLGISNVDLEKIPIGFEDRFQDIDTDQDGLSDQLEDSLATDKFNPDTDGDGFSDGDEVRNGYSPLGPQRLQIDPSVAQRLAGRILLQVERNGEAWYVHPVDGKRYYMKSGDAAYQIMRFLSLGISDADLVSVPIDVNSRIPKEKLIDCALDLNCFIDNINNEKSSILSSGQRIGIYTTIKHFEFSYEGDQNSFRESIFDIEIEYDDEYTEYLRGKGLSDEEIKENFENTQRSVREAIIGASPIVCTVTDRFALTEVLRRWELGNFKITVDGNVYGGDYAEFGDCRRD